eukprot:4811080-Pleurochrysis_carterae.AAC.4
MMAGEAARALRKSSATARSLSPTHLEKSSGPFTARKLVRASLASALAASVLEQPGGPYRSTPRAGRIPRRANADACFSGHSTASRSACTHRQCSSILLTHRACEGSRVRACARACETARVGAPL